MDVITTKEMLQLMDKKDQRGNPEPFSFGYVTWNANSKSGGKLIHYDNAELATSSGDKAKSFQKAGVRKNNHSERMTRNIFVGDEHPRTFNIRSIVRFNGKKVVY